MKSFLKFVLLLCALYALPLCSEAQMGIPQIENFPPQSYYSKDYVSSPQNFAISQDASGLIYIANTSGVMTYDGKEWNILDETKNKRFFKFAKDSSGRVFTGGLNELGYFAGNEQGKLQFHSLKHLLPDSLQNFKRISRIIAHQGKIFFLGGQHLFRWDGQGFACWQSSGPLARVFSLPDRVLLWGREGFFTLDAEGLSLIHKRADLPFSRVRAVFPLGDDVQNFIVATQKDGLFAYEHQGFSKINSPLDSLRVINATSLSEGSFAFGTMQKGLVILDQKGTLLSSYSKPMGLISNQVNFPYEDREGGIWVALEKGLSRIEYHSPIRIIGPAHQLNSLVFSCIPWQGHMWVGTLTGLYSFPSSPSPGFSPIQVKKIPAIGGEVFQIQAQGDQLQIIGPQGVFSIDRSLKIIKESRVPEASVFLSPANQAEMHFLGLTNGKLLRIVPADLPSNRLSLQLPHAVYSLVEGDSFTLWASYNGLSRIRFPEGWTGKAEVLTLDSSHGLLMSMGLIEATKINDKVVFGSEKGIFCFDEKTQRLVPDKSFGEPFSDGSHIAYNLTETKAGDVWVTTNFQTGILRKQRSGVYRYDSLPIIRAPITDVFSIYEAPDQKIWLGGTEALVLYDPQQTKNYQLPFQCLIKKVRIGEDSLLFQGAYVDARGLSSLQQPPSYHKEIPYRLNQVTFEYAAPFFEGSDNLEYSYWLLGQNTSWSVWSSQTIREYTNLREGSYTFKVRARNVYGSISETATYSFRILTPWYRSIWAYFIYFIGFGVFTMLLVRLRTRRLRRQKAQLEGIVAERTSKIRDQMSLLAQQKEEISKERERSENLLLNILPRETAEELKDRGKAESKRFDQVTVMFTDFKGFTQTSEKLSPEALVEEIHLCFSQFDRIIQKHGVEKIKTIGDSYMCVGGLPLANKTHPSDVIRAALEIRDFMAALKSERLAAGRTFFELRIGVHSGPVVAGIVGIKKFQYDIWGDTVNTASRMESSGKVGKINISHATWLQVQDQFNCQYRGEIEAKHKGKIRMYFAENKVSSRP